MKHDLRWTADRISRRLDLISPLIHQEEVVLAPFRYRKLGSPADPVPLGESSEGLPELAWNDYWGEWLSDFALHGAFTLPAGWEGSPVALYLPLGESGDFSHPEALVYVDGRPLGGCDRHHQELFLRSDECSPGRHELLLHGWIGLGGFPASVAGKKPFMRECKVVRVDEAVRSFVVTARVALTTAVQLQADDPVRSRLLNALNDAFEVLDTRHPLSAGFADTLPEAAERLRNGIEASGSPLQADVIGVGHAHIDVAWLWPLQQTRHKARRTFSTVLRLMDDFPDYRFSQSQAQLYRYVEEDDPDLFERIRERVAEGRWEVIGGTWVEPDCNATGSESLARQFLLGCRYFREKFGDAGTRVLWLPDTFGYAWSLPQLIREAGFEYFVTHKMSWNQYNRMPFQSMWWQGLDGSRVLTHLLTTPAPERDTPGRTTYNGDLSPRQVLGTWKGYDQKESHDELVTVYGYGDGGGGPTREMLEELEQMREHPGLPRLRAGTVREFFEGLERNSAGLPHWNGEFYLEYHRGTYTSQARMKRNNRKAEYLLHDAEFAAAWASLSGLLAYPREEFNRAWELLCLNQFHDILPGTSVSAVYEDAERDFAEIFTLVHGVRDRALGAICGGTGPVAVNPTSFGGTAYATLAWDDPKEPALVRAEGRPMRTQRVSGGVLVRLDGLEPYSLLPLALSDGAGTPGVVSDEPGSASAVTAQARAGGAFLENDQIRVEFDANGDMVRIFDKEAGREVLAPGEQGNVFQLFEDRPLDWEAWDIEIYYDDRMWGPEPAHRFVVVEEGPLRACLESSRRVRGSEITQRIYLYDSGKRIDFETRVDWQERHTLLKVAFPVNVFSPSATFDIQWGNVERPTHRNTTWDLARFETYAYKWADLSEGDYGVSLLNDCKYGYDVHDNVLRLSLLRGPTLPDPAADLGRHDFTYSLLPHNGDWRNTTSLESYRLNDPVFIVAPYGAGASEHGPSEEGRSEQGRAEQGRSEQGRSEREVPRFLVRCDYPGVVIETVKEAEDGDGLIVRIFENLRTRKRIRLETGFELAAAYRCDLLEGNRERLASQTDGVELEVGPYQIVTVLLQPAATMPARKGVER